MQKGKIANGANPDGTVNDETVYVPESWNDNMFNIFTFVENQGYTLIDDDLSQITKANKGLYNPNFTYNTSAIPEQTVSDVARGSDGKYYEAQSDGFSGDDPVGSVSGNWMEVSFDNGPSLDINSLPNKPTPIDTDNLVLQEAGGDLKKLSWTNLKANIVTGKLLQEVFFTTGTFATSSASIPLDNTIPQITEGTEFMQVSITPKSATSKLKITASVNIHSTSSVFVILALFRDVDVDSVSSTIAMIPNANNGVTATYTSVVDSSSTSPTTFKLRMGNDVVSTLNFNGTGSPNLGGSLSSSLIVEEIEV